jgi:DNA-binding NtrC family response regulator
VLFVAAPRTFRDSVAYFTRLLGHPIRTTGSVRAALAVLRHEAVDIVVIDDALDARALLADIQARGWHQLRVIVMTVVVTAADRTRWITVGAYTCLEKPFALGAYRQTLERAIEEVRTHRTTVS